MFLFCVRANLLLPLQLGCQCCTTALEFLPLSLITLSLIAWLLLFRRRLLQSHRSAVVKFKFPSVIVISDTDTDSNSNSSDDSDSEVEVTTQKAAEKRIDGSNLMDDKNGASTLRQTYDATTDTSLDALTKTKTSGGKAASSSGTTALKLRTSRPPIASTRSGYKSPGTSPIAQTSQEPTQLLPSASFQPAAKSKHSVKKSRKT